MATAEKIAAYRIRRENLKALIDSKYEGNRSAFARATGSANRKPLNVNLVNLSLTTNPEHHRPMGEKLARDIERRVGLPMGWMDEDRSRSTDEATIIAIPKVRGMRHGTQMIPDKLYVGSIWLERAVPNASAAANLAVWHVFDDTMMRRDDKDGGLCPGDVVIVDTGIDPASMADGVYLIDMAGQQVVRRVQRKLDGTFVLKTDNDLYESVTIDPRKQKNVLVMGKVLSKIRHTPV